jgi:CheY-like chemotaxis protein
MDGNHAKLLVIDDEDLNRRLYSHILTAAGYSVLVAENGDDAMKILGHQAVDLVLTDLYMPEREGIETIQAIRRTLPATRIVAMSGSGGPTLLRMARMLGADASLRKPIPPAELVSVVHLLLSTPMRRPGAVQGA